MMAPGLWPAVSTSETGSQWLDRKDNVKRTYLDPFFDYDASISSVVGWVNGRQEGQVDAELVGFQQSNLKTLEFLLTGLFVIERHFRISLRRSSDTLAYLVHWLY